MTYSKINISFQSFHASPSPGKQIITLPLPHEKTFYILACAATDHAINEHQDILITIESIVATKISRCNQCNINGFMCIAFDCRTEDLILYKLKFVICMVNQQNKIMQGVLKKIHVNDLWLVWHNTNRHIIQY